MQTATPAAERRADSGLEHLRAAATEPVSAASVAVFRMAFGILVAGSSIRFLANGWVELLYLAPENHLDYPVLGALPPLPAPWMHLELVVLAVCGVAIAIGWRTRPALVLYLLLFAHTELIDAALYLNHYWFMTLCGVLLLLVPTHHHWSVDASRGRVRRVATVDARVVWALRAQVGAVYIFAGLAKLNSDWLFHAQPLDIWLDDRGNTAVIGGLLSLRATAFLASWASALFDCTVVAWLSWSKTRASAFGVLVAFHLATGALFQIGVFPLVMIACATIFFDPSWPERFAFANRLDRPAADATRAAGPSRFGSFALVLLVGLQIVLPLRHYAYDGNVRWTEEGYYLAWRVMLTEKAGHVDYRVTDTVNGTNWSTGPEVVLTDWQANHAATRPEMIRRTAELLADHYQLEGPRDLEIRADAFVTMNGRPLARLIDPTVDLLADPGPAAAWILDESE